MGGEGGILQNLLLKGSPEASSTSPSTNFHGQIASVLAEQVGPWEGTGLHNIVRFQLNVEGE